MHDLMNFVQLRDVDASGFRQRQPKFSMAEVDIIVSEVGRHKEVLFTKLCDSVTNETKTRLWEAIAHKVNECGQQARSGAQIRRKWTHYSSETKRKLRRSQKRLEAGESIDDTTFNLSEEKVLTIMSQIEMPYDSFIETFNDDEGGTGFMGDDQTSLDSPGGDPDHDSKPPGAILGHGGITVDLGGINAEPGEDCGTPQSAPEDQPLPLPLLLHLGHQPATGALKSPAHRLSPKLNGLAKRPHQYAIDHNHSTSSQGPLSPAPHKAKTPKLSHTPPPPDSDQRLRVEQERLQVEKERLDVERQRLELERRRLEIEEERLQMERRRFAQCLKD